MSFPDLPLLAVRGSPPIDPRDSQTAQLEILNEIARIATLDLELRPMLQRITDTLVARFDWELVACVTVDAERKTFVCEAVTSLVPTVVVPGYSRPLGSGLVGRVGTTGRAVPVSRH